MQPRPHQIAQSDEGLKILRAYGIVYLGSEERTGKTLTAILIAEKSNAARILVVTKKGKPLDGWRDTFDKFKRKKVYRIINYHSLHKIAPGQFDLIILDEAHNYISSFPKRSSLWDLVAKYTKNMPIIYMSATPHAQGRQGLFNQFALSDWSPWHKYVNPYAWFNEYGIEAKIKLRERWVETYKKFQESRIQEETAHLFIVKTRKELGFEHEPEDKLHYVELAKSTKEQYNYIMKHRVIELGEHSLLLDTPMKLRTSLHMLEGGVAKNTVYSPMEKGGRVVEVNREKLDDMYAYHVYYDIGNTEKIDYILDKWGDTEDLAIMYNYKAEKYKLEKHFKNAQLLQATTNAEGIDLYQVKHLVIYSQDFSTARHTQRRARQANKKRDEPIIVNFLLIKGAVSSQVYKIVSVNKKNFVDTLFEREYL